MARPANPTGGWWWRTLDDYCRVNRAEVARFAGLTRSIVSDGVDILDGMAEEAQTQVCMDSVLPDPLEALASAPIGRLEPSGSLAVPLLDIDAVGHGQ